MQLLQEGEEPENFFWHGIGGRKDYEKVVIFLMAYCYAPIVSFCTV